jgi:GMP synthase (glutamine-hydrolysing)
MSISVYSSLLEFLHASIPSVSTELCKTVDPELKRRIIGDTFMNVMHVARRELQLLDDVFLAQGTLRPDLIESASTIASGHADAIKTHHNDTALVRELRNMVSIVYLQLHCIIIVGKSN